MTATSNVIAFPLRPIVRLGDRDTAAARGRIAGRWSKHIALPKRFGFVDEIARIGGVVMARLSKEDGTSDWYEARLIVPVSRSASL